MIPKIIHYCRFGKKPIPEKNKKCINCWKEFCPDYEIIDWNESNYDVSKNKYLKQAYESKKWAFVSDCARLDIVYNMGGIYLDVDVELVKSLEALLQHKAFMGIQTDMCVNTGLGFGSEKGHRVIGEMFHELYDDASFILQDGKLNLRPCPDSTTEFL